MDGPAQPMNQLFDTVKFRHFQQSQKRHTIMRSIAPQYKLPSGKGSVVNLQDRLRQSPSEYFNVYTRTVIPQIEARIEERLLHEYMRTIPNELERKEIFDSYIMRRHRLSKMPEEADMLTNIVDKDLKPKRMKANELRNTIATMDGSGTKYHTFSDIGRYTVFPAQARNRLFPTRAYGRIDDDEVKHYHDKQKSSKGKNFYLLI